MLRFGLKCYSKTLFVSTVKERIWPQNKVQNILSSPCSIKRHTGFFVKSNINELWKSVTCVSNAGKRRGRGKGNDRKVKVNLFLNRREGFGKANIYWPGLTGPIIQSKTLINIHKQPTKVESTDETPIPRKKKLGFKNVHPLMRGWSGRKPEGRILSPPDPNSYLSFPNFQSILISNKLVNKMTGNLGRKRMFSAIVLVGNQEGLIGLGRGSGTSFQIALRKSKNKAINQLISVDLIHKHTVNHDFYCEFGSCRLFVYMKPEGYGLKCHRVLQACCHLLGIKDLAVNIEGPSNNILNVVKAFLLGLLYKQKTYQQIADETKLHVVKFQKEKLYYPEVIASPKECLTSLETVDKPIFNHFIMDNNIVYKKQKKKIKRENYPKQHFFRNHKKVQTNILTEYGKYRSFLADYYPECQLTHKLSGNK